MDPPDDSLRQALEPQLQGRVTSAITAAFFAELADVGYGKLTVDAIVKRAGVGKAAVYRRWPTKRAMAIALITNVTVQADKPPDTGSFKGDVRALTEQLATVLGHPLVSRILPAVAAEAGRDRELETVLRDTVEGPRRKSYGALVHRGIERARYQSIATSTLPWTCSSARSTGDWSCAARPSTQGPSSVLQLDWWPPSWRSSALSRGPRRPRTSAPPS